MTRIDVSENFRMFHLAQYNNRGHVHSSMNHLDQAMADFNRALALKADFVEAMNNRGEVFHAQGKIGPALRDFNRALRIRPSFAPAYVNRARIECHMGRRRKAAAGIKRALRVDPELEGADFPKSCPAALPHEVSVTSELPSETEESGA